MNRDKTIENKSFFILNYYFLIKNILVYLSLSLTFFLLYFLFSLIFTEVLKNFFKINSDNIILILTLFSLILTTNIKYFLQKIINKIFYHKEFDLENKLYKYISISKNLVEIEDLFYITILILESIFQPKSFLIFENNILLKEKNKDLHKNYFSIQKELESNILRIELGKKISEISYSSHEKDFLNKFFDIFLLNYKRIKLSEEYINITIENLKNETKNEFIEEVSISLSHDLRSPLTACYNILNKIEFLTENNIYIPEIKDIFIRLKRTLSKMHQYITVSLDLEIYENSKLIIESKSLNIKELIESSISLHYESCERNGIKMINNFPDYEIFINGDPIRFERVISNLIYNAIKYTKNEINFTIEDKNDFVIIKISDNGNGISDKIKDKIFNKYSSEKSIGLGLYISHKYIEIMGGSLSFISEKDKGTIFEITMKKINQ